MLKIFVSLLLVALTGFVGNARALTESDARSMAVGESDSRIEALTRSAANANEQTVRFLQALADDAVKVTADKVFIVRDGKASDPVTGAEVPLPDEAEDVVSNNRMRGEIDGALASLQLLSSDIKVRRQAIKALQGEEDLSKLALLDKALNAETDAALKTQLALVRAGILLGSPDKAQRLEAARQLASSRNPATKTAGRSFSG